MTIVPGGRDGFAETTCHTARLGRKNRRDGLGHRPIRGLEIAGRKWYTYDCGRLHAWPRSLKTQRVAFCTEDGCLHLESTALPAIADGEFSQIRVAKTHGK